MRKDTKSSPHSPPVSEIVTLTTQNAKAMFDRMWSVAELLAEADQPESEIHRHRQAAEKTQP
jgi:hypothetical protein